MKLYHKEELTHSRIFFDKNPPPFLTVFIFFTVFLILGAFLISSKLIKPYIVEATGTVVTEDNTYVGVHADGVLVNMFYEEGSYVKEGETLFELTSGSEGVQYGNLASQLEQQNSKLDAMDLYVKSLEEGTNYMKNSGIEQEYYARVEYYLSILSDEQKNIKNLHKDIAKKNEKLSKSKAVIADLENEIKEYEQQVTELQSQFEQLIAETEDVFSIRSEMNLHLEELETEIMNLEANLEDKRIELETILEEEGDRLEAIKDEISQLEYGLENKKNERKSLKSESTLLDKKENEITKVETELETVKSKKETLVSELESKKLEQESLSDEIEQLNQQVESSNTAQTKMQLLTEVGNQRTTAETQINEIEGQLGNYQNQDELLAIKATHSGYVHYLVPLKEGMSVQRMQMIAEISENEESQIQVEVYIDARNISKVNVGDKVKVAIDGVNIQKFGTVTGKLDFIDVGTITQETSNGNVVLYHSIVTIDEKELTASDGDRIQVQKSMPVTARIVYEEETYLDWLLELLSFKNT